MCGTKVTANADTCCCQSCCCSCHMTQKFIHYKFIIHTYYITKYVCVLVFHVLFACDFYSPAWDINCSLCSSVMGQMQQAWNIYRYWYHHSHTQHLYPQKAIHGHAATTVAAHNWQLEFYFYFRFFLLLGSNAFDFGIELWALNCPKVGCWWLASFLVACQLKPWPLSSATVCTLVYPQQ